MHKLFIIISLLIMISCEQPKTKRVCKVLPVKKINKCYNHYKDRIWCNVLMSNEKTADISAPLHVGEERRVCKEISIELY